MNADMTEAKIDSKKREIIINEIVFAAKKISEYKKFFWKINPKKNREIILRKFSDDVTNYIGQLDDKTTDPTEFKTYKFRLRKCLEQLVKHANAIYQYREVWEEVEEQEGENKGKIAAYMKAVKKLIISSTMSLPFSTSKNRVEQCNKHREYLDAVFVAANILDSVLNILRLNTEKQTETIAKDKPTQSKELSKEGSQSDSFSSQISQNKINSKSQMSVSGGVASPLEGDHAKRQTQKNLLDHVKYEAYTAVIKDIIKTKAGKWSAAMAELLKDFSQTHGLDESANMLSGADKLLTLIDSIVSEIEMGSVRSSWDPESTEIERKCGLGFALGTLQITTTDADGKAKNCNGIECILAQVDAEYNKRRAAFFKSNSLEKDSATPKTQDLKEEAMIPSPISEEKHPGSVTGPHSGNHVISHLLRNALIKKHIKAFVRAGSPVKEKVHDSERWNKTLPVAEPPSKAASDRSSSPGASPSPSALVRAGSHMPSPAIFGSNAMSHSPINLPRSVSTNNDVSPQPRSISPKPGMP